MNSLFLVTCALFVGTAASLSEIIEELSYGIGSRTNVIFAANEVVTDVDVWAETTVLVPRLVLNSKADFELRGKINSKILSIVFLTAGSSSALLNIFKKTLKRRHWTDVLFIADAQLIDEEANWRWLFKWCWANGFTKILLTNTTAQGLLSFEPPPLFVGKNTTLRSYMKLRNGRLDFKGYEIRTASGDNPPRALLYTNKKGNSVFSGIQPNFLRLFVKRLNATLVLVNIADYTLTKCLTLLAAGEIDICGDSSFMDTNVIVTRPLFMSMGYVMVRHERPIAKFRYFLAPFTADVWLLIAVSIGYATLLLTCVSWQQFGVWNLGKYLLAAISSILSMPFTLRPLTGKSRLLIFVILFMAGQILSNLYLALLFRILGTNIYDRQVNTLEDLQRENISILGDEYHQRVFTTFGVSSIIFEQTLLVSTQVMDSHRRNLDPTYAYITMSDRIELYMYQQKFLTHPRMKLLEKSVLHMWGGFPIADSWPFEEQLNNHMIHSFAMGFYKRFQDETMEEAIRIGVIEFFKTESQDVAPLSIENFEMPAILLAFGYTAAVITFIFERLLSKREQ